MADKRLVEARKLKRSKKWDEAGQLYNELLLENPSNLGYKFQCDYCSSFSISVGDIKKTIVDLYNTLEKYVEDIKKSSDSYKSAYDLIEDINILYGDTLIPAVSRQMIDKINSDNATSLYEIEYQILLLISISIYLLKSLTIIQTISTSNSILSDTLCILDIVNASYDTLKSTQSLIQTIDENDSMRAGIAKMQNSYFAGYNSQKSAEIKNTFSNLISAYETGRVGMASYFSTIYTWDDKGIEKILDKYSLHLEYMNISLNEYLASTNDSTDAHEIVEVTNIISSKMSFIVLLPVIFNKLVTIDKYATLGYLCKAKIYNSSKILENISLAREKYECYDKSEKAKDLLKKVINKYSLLDLVMNQSINDEPCIKFLIQHGENIAPIQDKINKADSEVAKAKHKLDNAKKPVSPASIIVIVIVLLLDVFLLTLDDCEPVLKALVAIVGLFIALIIAVNTSTNKKKYESIKKEYEIAESQKRTIEENYKKYLNNN